MPRNIGKKPKKFQYTYQIIADIVGLHIETIRKFSREGVFNPEDLKSVIKFINERVIL